MTGDREVQGGSHAPINPSLQVNFGSADCMRPSGSTIWKHLSSICCGTTAHVASVGTILL